MEDARPVRAARGTARTARSRQTEAPPRMLCHNLDPATGAYRHVDAGYDGAAEVATAHGLRVPMAES